MCEACQLEAPKLGCRDEARNVRALLCFRLTACSPSHRHRLASTHLETCHLRRAVPAPRAAPKRSSGQMLHVDTAASAGGPDSARRRAGRTECHGRTHRHRPRRQPPRAEKPAEQRGPTTIAAAAAGARTARRPPARPQQPGGAGAGRGQGGAAGQGRRAVGGADQVYRAGCRLLGALAAGRGSGQHTQRRGEPCAVRSGCSFLQRAALPCTPGSSGACCSWARLAPA